MNSIFYLRKRNCLYVNIVVIMLIVPSSVGIIYIMLLIIKLHVNICGGVSVFTSVCVCVCLYLCICVCVVCVSICLCVELK